jgi:IclR family pca regulon transcriptional regulator
MNSEVKSAGRVLDLLDHLAECREPVRLSEVVEALALPKSSAHGLMQTLVARGRVTRDAAGRYSLVEAARHGFPFRGHEEPLVVTAMPHMQRLRDESGETVLLSTLNARGDIRRLAKCVSHQPVRYDINLDSPIAGYCTATGRALLAFAAADVIEAYFARVQIHSYTAFTVTEIDRLRAILAKVRCDGYAINDQEFITGSTGIAVPIFDAAGKVVGALNLGTLTSRFVQRREELILLVRTSGEAISRELGYRRPSRSANKRARPAGSG